MLIGMWFGVTPRMDTKRCVFKRQGGGTYMGIAIIWVGATIFILFYAPNQSLLGLT